MQEQQLFQSKAQLAALQIHAAWEKFENVVLFPFRWLSDKMGQTHCFREQGQVQLRAVK